MPQYLYRDARGDADEIILIEDKSVFSKDREGSWAPGFEFIDSRTIRAHPFIIDVLLGDAERLWTMDEVLTELVA